METYVFEQFVNGEQTSERIMMGFESEEQARQVAQENAPWATLGKAIDFDEYVNQGQEE